MKGFDEVGISDGLRSNSLMYKAIQAYRAGCLDVFDIEEAT